MPFTYRRIIHFRDTDAAGVVYFTNLLALCHEAYEASLAASGIDLKSFFSSGSLAFPIVHTSGDFFRPLFCGDGPTVQATPQVISETEFELHYAIFPDDSGGILVARAITRHVCIQPTTRQRATLPAWLQAWLEEWG